jgi:hypothetical protein
MKNTTVLMAAMLAAAIVIAVGLTILPSSVHEAQANPCANQLGDVVGTIIAPAFSPDERECTIIGNDIDFEED